MKVSVCAGTFYFYIEKRIVFNFFKRYTLSDRDRNIHCINDKTKGADEMKLAIILETKEHEKAWNAFRFGVAALKKGHQVKFFLMGEAVEVESIEDEQYDVPVEMKKLEEQGGELLACGTCLKSRQLEDQTSCPISTMFDCVEMVEWADKIVTF